MPNWRCKNRRGWHRRWTAASHWGLAHSGRIRLTENAYDAKRERMAAGKKEKKRERGKRKEKENGKNEAGHFFTRLSFTGLM